MDGVDRTPTTPAYDRTLSTRSHVDGDVLVLEATLRDEAPGVGGWQVIHDMTVVARVERRRRTLLAIDATMRTFPHGGCPVAVGAVQRLVGLDLGPGYGRVLRERMGGVEGCSHLVTLVKQVATVAALSVAGELIAEDPEVAVLPRRDFFAHLRDHHPALTGACQAWAPDGPVIAELDAPLAGGTVAR